MAVGGNGGIYINKAHKNVQSDIENFMYLLKECLYNQKNTEIESRSYDWNFLYKIAAKNNIAGIIYSTLAKSEIWNVIPSPIRFVWERDVKNNILKEAKKYFAIKLILEKSKNEDIKLVFFKGCILANLYPQYLLRISGDTDIFVYERDLPKAVDLLERIGYKKDEEHSKENVQVYHSAEFLHLIELHTCLWEDYEGPKMTLLEKMDLTEEKSLISINVCGMDLLTLGYTEHLIYQMFHIIKHFSLETIGIRYLVDITLYIRQYYDKIDLKVFWDKMNLLGYSSFCYSFFELCIQYLDLEQEILEFAGQVQAADKNELLWDMITLGGMVNEDPASWQILGIITPYLIGDEAIPTSKFARQIKVLFPSRKALPDKFNYAKENGFLLPIAWVHKMVDFIARYKRFYRENKGHIDGEWYNAGKKLSVAEYRLYLMKSFGLVEELKKSKKHLLK